MEHNLFRAHHAVPEDRTGPPKRCATGRRFSCLRFGRPGGLGCRGHRHPKPASAEEAHGRSPERVASQACLLF